MLSFVTCNDEEPGKIPSGLHNLPGCDHWNRTAGSVFVTLKHRSMKKNMGTADRIIRLIIVAVIALLYFTDKITGTLGIILMVLAGVFLLTSIFSFCPLYWPFGLKTRATKK
jgi:hypothetical protein